MQPECGGDMLAGAITLDKDAGDDVPNSLAQGHGGRARLLLGDVCRTLLPLPHSLSTSRGPQNSPSAHGIDRSNNQINSGVY
jgi:hypothetical protein